MKIVAFLDEMLITSLMNRNWNDFISFRHFI